MDGDDGTMDELPTDEDASIAMGIMSRCAGEGREMRARQEAAGLVFARARGLARWWLECSSSDAHRCCSKFVRLGSGWVQGPRTARLDLELQGLGTLRLEWQVHLFDHPDFISIWDRVL